MKTRKDLDGSGEGVKTERTLERGLERFHFFLDKVGTRRLRKGRLEGRSAVARGASNKGVWSGSFSLFFCHARRIFGRRRTEEDSQRTWRLERRMVSGDDDFDLMKSPKKKSDWL